MEKWLDGAHGKLYGELARLHMPFTKVAHTHCFQLRPSASTPQQPHVLEEPRAAGGQRALIHPWHLLAQQA